MTVPVTCPDPVSWTALLDGRLAENDQTELAEHLDRCPTCQRIVEQLTEETGAWSQAAHYLPGNPPDTDPILKRVMNVLKEQSAGADTNCDLATTGTHDLNFLAPSPDPGQLGRIGHYEILGVIGRGGMGIVLKARDTNLDRVVAIKVLAPQLAASAAARVRFNREARAMAQLHHENSVAVHGVEEVGGLPYLVMEYVRGASLEELLHRHGPLPIPDILRIGAQIARGLDAAHHQDLVHRDVKPANILLERGTDRVKLTDFGLARAADDVSLTQSGVLAGTPLYMAPEQARGEAVDLRSDLFSLGSVLYAMCTGRPPFQGTSVLAVLRKVSDAAPPSLRTQRRRIPEWLIEIIEVLHERNPEARYASAAEVAELLERCLAHVQDPSRVPAPAATRRPKLVRRRPWVLLSCLALAALFLLALPVSLGTWWLVTHFKSSGKPSAPIARETQAPQGGEGNAAPRQEQPIGPKEDPPEEFLVELNDAHFPPLGFGPPWLEVSYRFTDGKTQPRLGYFWHCRQVNQPFPAPPPFSEQRQAALGLTDQGTCTLPFISTRPGATWEVSLAIMRPDALNPADRFKRVSNIVRVTR